MGALVIIALAGDSLPVYDLPDIMVVSTEPGQRVDTVEVSEEPGARLRRFGVMDYGNMLTPGLGGLPSRHTEVSVAGVPVNSPATGTSDLSFLPLALTGRAMVRLSGRPRLDLYPISLNETGVAGGSFGLARAWSVVGTRGLRVGGLAERVAGNYSFRDEFGVGRVRENSDRQQVALMGLARKGPWSAFALASATERGVPGSVGFPTPRARLRDTMLLFSAGWDGFGFYGTREATLYENQGALSATLASRLGLSARGGSFSLRAEALSAWNLRKYQAFWNIGLRGRTWLVRPALALWDRSFYPGLEMGAERGVFRAFGFYGIVAPALNDLAWPEDEFSRANPDLVPEKILAGETGLDAGWLRAWVSVKGVKDYIAWVSAEKWTPVNLDMVVSPELGGEFLWPWLSAGARWNPVRWESRRLPGVPDVVAWTGFQSPHLALTAVYTGPRAATLGGARRLPGFLTLDAEASAKWPVSGFPVSLSLGAFNLLDETPQALAGYPLAGRRFYLEIYSSWR